MKKYEEFIEYFVIYLIEYKWDMWNNIIYFYCMLLANNGFIHACELNILKWSGEQLPTTCIYYLLFTFGCSCKCESARSDFIGAWEELASKPQISWARPLRRRLFHAGHYVDLMVRKQNWRFLFSSNNKTIASTYYIAMDANEQMDSRCRMAG